MDLNVGESFVDLKQILKRLKVENEVYKETLFYVDEEIKNFRKDTLEEANQAYNGMIKLPGTGGVPKFVGNPPRWFEKMDDNNEFLWQLSRMNYWVPMLQAFVLTGEKKYAKRVIDEFIDWDEKVFKELNHGLLEKDPSYYNGPHPLRILECGIRLYKTWPFLIRYLAGTDFLTEDVLARYLKSVYMQSKIIEKYSPILWPNADHNHYLMENLGMLTTALMFPELKESASWKEQGIKELERSNRVQLTVEGGQIEGCPGYHNGAMFWFGLLPLLGQDYNFDVSKEYIHRFEEGLNYSLYCIRPTGRLVTFGDTNANDVAVTPFVFGYLVTGKTYWLQHALQFYSKDAIIKKAKESIQYTKNPQAFVSMLMNLEPLEKENLLPTSFFNPSLGQIFARNSWTKDTQFFAMTGRSPVQNGHAHIDVLSFEYVAFDRNIITDPGKYTYKNTADRRYFKSSVAHSTVTINEKDFFEYLNSFSFGPQKEGKLTVLKEDGKTITGIGYNRAYEPTIIQRGIALIEDRFLLIIDKLTNRKIEDKVTRSFHFDYNEIQVKDDYTAIAIDENVNTKIVNSSNQDILLKNGRTADFNDLYRNIVEVQFRDLSSENLYATIVMPYLSTSLEPEINMMISKSKINLNVDGKSYEVDASNLEKLVVKEQ